MPGRSRRMALPCAMWWLGQPAQPVIRAIQTLRPVRRRMLIIIVALFVSGCGSPSLPSSVQLTGPPTSAGPTLTVPDVTGEPVSQAVHTLEADGFDPGDTGLAPTEIVRSTD